ncbi:hypothetical protein Tco_0659462, partial [Tanacetum coccineum]
CPWVDPSGYGWIEMSSEDCSECSDLGSDLCIEESTPDSLVSVICHPVEERVGCCLEDR